MQALILKQQRHTNTTEQRKFRVCSKSSVVYLLNTRMSSVPPWKLEFKMQWQKNRYKIQSRHYIKEVTKSVLRQRVTPSNSTLLRAAPTYSSKHRGSCTFFRFSWRTQTSFVAPRKTVQIQMQFLSTPKSHQQPTCLQVVLILLPAPRLKFSHSISAGYLIFWCWSLILKTEDESQIIKSNRKASWGMLTLI